MTVGNNDIIRGVLNMTMVNGDIAKNVFTWQVDKVSVGDWSDVVAAGFVEAALDLIWDEIIQDIRLDMSFDTVDLYKWVSPDWDYLATVASNISSTGNAEVTPPGVAALMTAYTALNRVFGRKFIYGYIESAILSGAIDTDPLTRLGNAAAEYLTAYSGGTMGPLDYLVPGVYSSKVSDFVPFSNVAVVKDTLSYQRRRKTGVGA